MLEPSAERRQRAGSSHSGFPRHGKGSCRSRDDNLLSMSAPVEGRIKAGTHRSCQDAGFRQVSAMPSAHAEVVARHLLPFPVSSCILAPVLWFVQVRNLVVLARRQPQHGRCRMKCGDPDPGARCSICFLPWRDVTCVVCKPWPTLVPARRVHKWEKSNRKGSAVLQRDLDSLRSWSCSNKCALLYSNEKLLTQEQKVEVLTSEWHLYPIKHIWEGIWSSGGTKVLM